MPYSQDCINALHRNMTNIFRQSITTDNTSFGQRSMKSVLLDRITCFENNIDFQIYIQQAKYYHIL